MYMYISTYMASHVPMNVWTLCVGPGPSPESESGLPIAVVAGGVAGGAVLLVLVVAIVIVIIVIYRRKLVHCMVASD